MTTIEELFGEVPAETQEPILSLLSVAKLRDIDIAHAIGMPRSTVQAMATGRVAERFSRDQKVRLAAMIREIVATCDEALARLGERD